MVHTPQNNYGHPSARCGLVTRIEPQDRVRNSTYNELAVKRGETSEDSYLVTIIRQVKVSASYVEEVLESVS
jgi:hypothetical protein